MKIQTAQVGTSRTGQVVSYLPNDDGDLQIGSPGINPATGNQIPRFKDLGNNILVDNPSVNPGFYGKGIEWIKNTPLVIPGDNGTIGYASPFWSLSGSSGGQYIAGDIVCFQGSIAWYNSSYPYAVATKSIWICNTTHTPTSFQTNYGSGYWTLMSFGNDLNCVKTARGNWDIGNHYKVGEYISGYDGSNTYAWINTVEHDTYPSSPANWSPGQVYHTGDQVQDTISAVIYILNSAGDGQTSKNFSAYADSTSYSTNDIVLDSSGTNNYYVCTSGHTSNGSTVYADITNSGSTVWTLVDDFNPSNQIGMFKWDRQNTPSYWSVAYSGNDFQHEIADHPEYWIKSPFLNTNAYSSTIETSDQLSLAWIQWFAEANALTYAGRTGWRLPNINELKSLGDYSQGYLNGDSYHPMVVSNLPYINTNYCYWTSTTQPNQGSGINAMYVDFQSGNVYEGNTGKSNNYYALLVRDIQ